MKRLMIIFCSMWVSTLAYSQSIENGKAIFQDNCVICHGIGKGRLIGPDLMGVTERREKEWIFSFIRNSSELIAAGDETAKTLFTEFNNISMPHYDFSSEEMENLMAFIDETGKEAALTAVIEPFEAIKEAPQTMEATITHPTWFLVSASIIGLIIIALLVVIFWLFRLTLRFQKV